jgi:hypothetical protein
VDLQRIRREFAKKNLRIVSNPGINAARRMSIANSQIEAVPPASPRRTSRDGPFPGPLS